MLSPHPDRRQFLRSGLLGAGVFALGGPTHGAAEEVLYNGIRLPSPWPPAIKEVPKAPVTPPYLRTPPAVIPIGVGRQLFVDDFLIDSTTLKRTHHRPTFHHKSPVLADGMVFSDGVWYDPAEKAFKMWYFARGGTAYAVSGDGITWERPKLDVKKGTNLVLTAPRDSCTVWLDLQEKDPARRYKMFRSASWPAKKSWTVWVHYSKDGIHWGEGKPTGSCGDRSTVFYNPFRKRWVYSLRHGWGQPRRRRYWEAKDGPISDAQWGAITKPAMWCGADNLDPPRADYKITPQLYNLDCVAYESLLLGLFTIWRGQPGPRPKPNEVCVGYSRDGWHWHRPDRQGFLPVSEKKGDWNWGNVQSAGGCCLVVGEQLYFYCSGRGRGNVTSLAVLRRDGFASMDAGAREGTLTTRPVRFEGKHLFVNLDAPGGELRAEVLDEKGAPLGGLGRDDCLPARGTSTAQAVRWKGVRDIGHLAGKVARFRFTLRAGRLYSFWASPEESGASRGYVAAGGPGLTGLTDTVGQAGKRG